MLEHINELITSIVVVIIIATFLELILPSGSLSKYVRLVIGLMIVLIILNPIIHLLEEEFMINPNLFEQEERSEQLNDIMARGEDLKQTTYEQVDSEYERMIAEEIDKRVDDRFDGYYLSDLEMDYQSDEDQADYGRIERLDVFLAVEASETSNSSSGKLIEPIKEIKIDLSEDGEVENGQLSGDEHNEQSDSAAMNSLSQDLKQQFKDELSYAFQLEDNRISVEVIN